MIEKPPEDGQPMGASSQIVDASVYRLIGLGLVTRLLVDTGVQIFFPFLPVIAAGMGISTIALGRLVSVRSLMGLLSPLFGSIADRGGYRLVMRLGLFVGAAGYLTLGLSDGLGLAALGMVLAGLGNFAFVPTLQAYLSTRLPYSRRARGLGILEYAWALSGIVGLFLMGQLMEIASWRLPLFVLAVGLFAFGLYYRKLPAAPLSRRVTPRRLSLKLLRAFRPLEIGAQLDAFFDFGSDGRSVRGVVVASGLFMYAATHLFISYGSWLATEYELGPAALGQVALVLGLADLGGSFLVSLISDWLGKRRSVLAGGSAVFLSFVLLPLFNLDTITAVIGLVLVRFSFEFTIVSNLTLSSEQLATQRAKVLTLGAAAGLMGATISGFTGPWVYDRFGIVGLSWPPAAVLVLTLIVVLTQIEERE